MIMEPISTGNRAATASALQKAEAVSHLREGISLLLSQWTGLQMAIKNGWGGHDSLQKSKQLATDILSWFFQSNAHLSLEDLENFLNESMLFSFNTEIEDGSIEEVAEQLMIMHEEYWHGSHY
ncbi:hypothetical protein F2P56_015703 [Juglans regia]|uniref:Pre-rRNA-processing protein TSR2 homolog n=3 Tax=Juglans TaxID=16718 RepID=A0A833XFC6_JUGRE|nr:pre-rRNA-processing protein TSR2 homolog [Juglans regia]KAF5465721.1 hypothetical protein F2P56_015702 [Juglans regia]KAF5465722.1 hypothetical protein F2P56_015703 [Juglans regia]